MKIKIFKVRTEENLVAIDQKVIDDFLEKHDIIHLETAFMNEEKVWSVCLYYNELQNVPTKSSVKDSKTPKYSAESETLSENEIKILNALKIWRSEKAKEQNLPSYFIATNKELFSVAKFKPLKKEELLDIKGFGKHKIENYGEEILLILESV